jgi:alpha-tubulin suppressor-like RCC1 family protein
VPAGCPEPATRAGTVLPNGSTALDLLVDCPPLPGTQRIAAGAGFACAIADQGTFCWGDNSFGQLGNGTTTTSLLPSPVSVPFTSLAVGSSHACGVEPNGIVRCWGRGNSGQLGNGSTSDRLTPVTGPGGPYVLVAAGGAHTCALTVDGRVFCWGANESGQLGIGSTSAATIPQQVTGAPAFATLTAGRSHTCALDLSGAAWCWGANTDGQLGDGTTTDRVRPVAVTGGNFFKAIATGGTANHACGTSVSGVVRCWGSGQFGQLGSGNATNTTSPIAVSTSEALKEVTVADRHSCAIAERTSEAFCWGANSDGQIGDNTTTNRSAPTPTNASARYSRTTTGEGFSCAVTFGAVTGEDNTIVISRRSLLCWGRNTSGQFGRGTTTSALTPTAAATGLTIQ